MIEICNRKVLLTINEKGQLSTPVSNASSKEIRSKIMTDPFESQILNNKGIPTGKYITPKGNFKVSNDYNERIETKCSKKLTLSENVVNYFISNGSCPYFINSKKWEKMNEEERLKVHLSLNAEGKDFSYEII